MTDIAELKGRIKSLQSASREKVKHFAWRGDVSFSNLTLYMLFRISKIYSGGLNEM